MDGLASMLLLSFQIDLRAVCQVRAIQQLHV